MKEKNSNLAVVNNTTLQAAKSINLHHYDINSALQTTLEFNELLAIFSHKIQKLIPHDAYIYNNEAFGLQYKKGVLSKHSCTYTLNIENMPLGELKLIRQHRFENKELKLLETLLCSLIYPLKNATLYHQALTLAYTDPLTKTRNRTAFKDSVKREITLAKRNSRNLSLIFLDIDHFKLINDEYGHDCGDMALRAIAEWIKKSIRESDIVFRYGGDEFVILLSDTDINGAEQLAERIRSRIENHTLAYGMKTLRLTASLGISTLHHDDSIDELVKRADDAMYLAKIKGRNQVAAAV